MMVIRSTMPMMVFESDEGATGRSPALRQPHAGEVTPYNAAM